MLAGLDCPSVSANVPCFGVLCILENEKKVYYFMAKYRNSSSTDVFRFILLHATLVHAQLPAINLAPLSPHLLHDRLSTLAL